jgi:alginate O-acetyltransferase complex protein AlgI
VMVVFLLSGLWHGANWTFLVWGGLNGLLVAAPAAVGLREPAHSGVVVRALRSLATFHLVLLTWVFFRAASLSDAALIYERVGRALPQLPALLRVRLADPGMLLSLAVIAVLIGVEIADEGQPIWERLRHRPTPLRWAVYYAMLAALVVLGTWNLRQFVYMQF